MLQWSNRLDYLPLLTEVVYVCAVILFYFIYLLDASADFKYIFKLYYGFLR